MPNQNTQEQIFFNSRSGTVSPNPNSAAASQQEIRNFHAQLPSYAPTPLHPLENLATETSVRAVFVKDESARLCLPSFKILGASWGAFRAVITSSSSSSTLGLPLDTPLEKVGLAAREAGISLFTATEGNHGRALAYMANILGIPSRIYIPKSAHPEAAKLISAEGGDVIVTPGHYEDAMEEAWRESRCTRGGLFIQDTAFEGYEEVPRWIVDGYSTLLSETEEQLADLGLKHTLIVTPVGVGSLAHAVVRHCKSPPSPRDDTECAVLTAEPDTAACLLTSLREGQVTPIQTTTTIMDGLNCGTVSLTAFPDLRAGVDACASVSDRESHDAVKFLHANGISSGPCGAASLAAFRRLACSESRPEWLNGDSVVVLLNTEGERAYTVPS